ncbi:MAG TPA: gamma carbonic anhydrase family protein [Chloroflexota bacterium]|nr:gamma carbonic anhydrase family protein [Chloroflexota bacterium]
MIVEFGGYRPHVARDAFIAPTAVLIGNVTVHAGASVWYGAVLRGDQGEPPIVVGARSNVQDNCVIHVATDLGTFIGDDVTVGHGAILEGCTVEDGALIGMNAVVLDHARVGSRSLVAANSTVLVGTEIPPNSVAAGSPAEVKKELAGEAARWIETASAHYVELARRYREEGL